MSARLLPAAMLANEGFDLDGHGHSLHRVGLRAGGSSRAAAGWTAVVGEGLSETHPLQDAEAGHALASRNPESSFRAELEAVQTELMRVRGQAEDASNSSYKTGFDDGFRQGLAQNQAELDGFRAQISTALRSAEAARRELLEQSDMELVKLSVAIAEKILNRQIQIDSDALQGLVQTALARLAGKTIQVLRIHPADRAIVEKELLSLGPRRAIRIDDDSSLSRGALIFDTDFGSFDCSVSTQLSEIETGLVDRLRRSGH